MDRVDPVGEVALESPAVEHFPIEPARVRPVLRGVPITRLLRPGRQGPGRPVELGRPALAVGPDAVEAVLLRDLVELGDEELVDVGAEDARGVGVALPVLADAGPIGVLGDGLLSQTPE